MTMANRFSFVAFFMPLLFATNLYYTSSEAAMTGDSSQFQVQENEMTHSLDFRAYDRGQFRPLRYSPSYYGACGIKNKHCFPGTNTNCFQHRNCTYLVTWKLIPNTEYIEFHVITEHLTDKLDGKLCSKKNLINVTQYLAIGFSGRSTKGQEKLAVVECSIMQTDAAGNQTKQVKFAWSSKTEYMRWNTNCSESTSIGKLINCKVNLDKAAMLCQFQVKRRIVVKHEIFNFEDSQYYIHLTSGCNGSDIKRSFLRGGRYISSDKVVHFHRKDGYKSAYFRSNYALWHGSLMTVAWTILVPNGVFVSRYFKESFVEVSIFKYRIWFAFHSFIMFMAFLITLGAMGTILQERSQAMTKFHYALLHAERQFVVDFAWPLEKSTQLHYNLGFTAALSLIGQVSIGWIRCHGRKLRRSFAAIHLFIGSICYIISLVLIGLSYNVGMPCNIVYYISASSVWTLACHVAMTIHFYLLDKQLGLYIYRAFYPFPIPPVTYDELPGTKIRLSIFLVHLTGSILITSGMLVDYLTNAGCK